MSSTKLTESLQSHQILADSKLAQLRTEHSELYGNAHICVLIDMNMCVYENTCADICVIIYLLIHGCEIYSKFTTWHLSDLLYTCVGSMGDSLFVSEENEADDTRSVATPGGSEVASGAAAEAGAMAGPNGQNDVCAHICVCLFGFMFIYLYEYLCLFLIIVTCICMYRRGTTTTSCSTLRCA